jgi:hypothetical protein
LENQKKSDISSKGSLE